MVRLFLLVLALGLLHGCATSTPIERAEAICIRLGDPSPACKERQFNIERTRQDAFMAEQRKYLHSDSALSTPFKPSIPEKSHYDQVLQEGQERIKQDCALQGGFYQQDSTGASCTR